MLKVILNSQLEKNDKLKTTKHPYHHYNGDISKYNIETDKCLTFDFEHKSSLLKGNETKNGLVNAFLDAYNSHSTLKISAYHLHICIQQVLSTFINKNAQVMKDFFINKSDTEGKIKLTYFEFSTHIIEEKTFKQLAKSMVNSMDEHVHNKEFMQLIKMDYSNVPAIANTVSSLLVMNSFKEYFEFEMILMCGIPAILLDGSIADWRALYNKFVALQKMFEPFQDLNEWFNKMDVILKMFVQMREMATEGTVQATEYQREMWSRVITYTPYGSGGQTRLGGWLSLLTPYRTDGSLKNFKNFPLFDLKNKPPLSKNYRDIYEYQDDFATYFASESFNTIQDSMYSTELKIKQDTFEGNFSINSGFYYQPHLNKEGEIEPNVGYIIV